MSFSKGNSDEPEPRAYYIASFGEMVVDYKGLPYSKSDMQELISRHDKRRPREPDDSECCGDGCDPCVWDTYDLRFEKFKDQRNELEALLALFDAK